MRWPIITLVLAFGFGCRSGSVESLQPEAVRVLPLALDFGDVWVGRSAEQSLTLTNPNPTPVDVAVLVPAPFQTDRAEVTIAAGETLTLSVRFRPDAEGDAAGVVVLGAANVTLHGVGRQPPSCAPIDGCHRSDFDFEAGICVMSRAPDGADCTATYACFAAATCVAGECIGTATSCADGDRCTLDACGATGCFHPDGTDECPLPTNPCLVQACDSALGCGTQPVPDGTSCGTRDCASAHICLNGQCAVRAAPQTQLCVDEVVGIAGDCGDADGPGSIARFTYLKGLAIDRRNGLAYVSDGYTLKSITPGGVVTTVAGQQVRSSPGVDGVGTSARFVGPLQVAVDSRGNVFVDDSGDLRKVTARGLSRTFSDAGQLVGLAPDDSLLVVVDSPSGARLDRISPLGQRLSSMPFRWLISKAVVTASGRTFLMGGTDPIDSVSELLVDGGLSLVVPPRVTLRDGGQVEFSQYRPVALSRDERQLLLFGLRLPAQNVVVAFGLDGGEPISVRPLQWSLVNLEGVSLVDDGDGLLIARGCSLTKLLADGGEVNFAGGYRATGALLSFPEPPQDGPISSARLGLPTDLVSHPTNGFLVRDVDPQNSARPLWRWVHDGVVETFSTAHGQFVLQDGALWTHTRGRDGGGLVEQLDSSGAVTASLEVPANEYFEPKMGSSPTGLLLVKGRDSTNDIETFRVGLDGGVALLGTIPSPRAVVLGVASDGRDGVFLSYAGAVWRLVDGGVSAVTPDIGATGLATAPNGDLLVAAGASLRRVDTSGRLTTVAQLSDTAFSVLVEDGGTVLVSVRRAVLRLRP